MNTIPAVNIPDYISSGILELYVAGALSEQESIDITKLVHQHAEIRVAVENIELAFIKYAELHAPSISSKTTRTILAIAQVSKPLGKVIRMLSRKRSLQVIAASLAIFLMASLLTNVYQYDQLQTKEEALRETNQKLIALESKEAQLAQNVKAVKLEYEGAVMVLRDPATKIVKLNALTAPKSMKAKVYWNKESQAVYVDASQLPALPPDQSYQFWSITDMDPLTPVSAGLLADCRTDADKFFKVENVEKAVAFAISLEPKGGSSAPTAVQVLGKL